MKQKNNFFLSIFFFLSIIIPLTGVAQQKNEKIIGYLIDVKCGSNRIDLLGNDITRNPEKHNRHCMLYGPCVESGYGLLIKNKQIDRYEFFPFDENGSTLALKLLKKSTKNNDFKVEIIGIRNQNQIKVISVKEIL